MTFLVEQSSLGYKNVLNGTKKKGYFKNHLMTGLLGNQKWFCYGITSKTPNWLLWASLFLTVLVD